MCRCAEGDSPKVQPPPRAGGRHAAGTPPAACDYTADAIINADEGPVLPTILGFLLMGRLSRALLAAAGVGAVSLALYLVGTLSRGGQVLAGMTLLRAATLLALSAISLLPLLTAWLLRRKPAREAQIDHALQRSLAREPLRQVSQFLLTFLLLAMLAAAAGLWMLQPERFAVFLPRFAWLFFLLAGLASLALSSSYLQPLPRRWKSALLWSAGFILLAILLQAWLLARLEEPFSPGLGSLILVQAIQALAIWAFFSWSASLPVQERNLWRLVGLFTAGLVLIEWLTLARKLDHLRPHLALWAPALVFGMPLLAAGLLSAWQVLRERLGHRAEHLLKAGRLLLLIGLTWVYLRAAYEHAAKVNINRSFSDQGSYLQFIQKARELNFRYTGDQNRMPAYPFFQALLYSPTMNVEELFIQAKQVNILLSLALLALLFLIFRKHLTDYQSVLLVLIVAFSLFVFKSPYIQAEISFYFLFFLSFLLMARMLLKPSWPLGLACGAVLGLTYLTKGSLLPAVALFSVLFLVQEGLALLKAFRRSPGTVHATAGVNADLAPAAETNPPAGQPVQFAPAQAVSSAPLRASLARLASFALLLLVFGLIIYPYARQMKARFGSYFYNVNTSIYIWYDEMQQAYDGEARYRFAEQIPPDLPQGQIPSLRKYLREHTPSQMLARFLDGVKSELGKIGWQFSVTNYQLAYLWLFSLVFLLDLRSNLAVLRKYPYLVAFGLLFFLGYLAAFAWYTPIASGRRFTYSLYLPFLFSVFVAINAFARRQADHPPNQPPGVDLKRLFCAANLVIALTLVYNIWLVVNTLLFIDRYGS